MTTADLKRPFLPYSYDDTGYLSWFPLQYRVYPNWQDTIQFHNKELSTAELVKHEYRPKRIRTVFTTEQLDELENLFQKIAYPTRNERQYLSEQLNLSDSRIQIWFKNRRARCRKHFQNQSQSSLDICTTYNLQKTIVTTWQLDRSKQMPDFFTLTANSNATKTPRRAAQLFSQKKKAKADYKSLPV